MKENITKEFNFYGDKLLGVKDEKGNVWLGVKQACYGIGLSTTHADRQIKNIKASLLFKGSHVKFDVVQNEGGRMVKREVVCLHEKFVPLWLAQISITPKMKKENPEAVEKLLKYQLEVAGVLHKTFYDDEENKANLHDALGIKGDIVEVKDSLDSLRETLTDVVDSMTLNTYQQSKILKAGKDRVGVLLGGAHSDLYKRDSRLYFANLWTELREEFQCASYKDINPKRYQEALEWIGYWDYD